jgi:hypothetical protein
METEKRVECVDEPKTETRYSKLKSTLKSICENLTIAQAQRGAFSMQDCANFKACNQILTQYFANLETETKSNPKVDKAFETLYELTKIQQAKGVFTIEGSCTMLNLLTELQNWIKAH